MGNTSKQSFKVQVCWKHSFFPRSERLLWFLPRSRCDKRGCLKLACRLLQGLRRSKHPIKLGTRQTTTRFQLEWMDNVQFLAKTLKVISPSSTVMVFQLGMKICFFVSLLPLHFSLDDLCPGWTVVGMVHGGKLVVVGFFKAPDILLCISLYFEAAWTPWKLDVTNSNKVMLVFYTMITPTDSIC